MKNNPEGRIPIEDLGFWKDEFKAAGMKSKDVDELIRYHYFENVRAAKEEGLSREDFIEKLVSDVLSHLPKTKPHEIEALKGVISKIWDRDKANYN